MRAVAANELKEIQISILKAVAAFCEENHLSYFLTGGTLIGAVRHRGFIPWDDDVDLNMPRKDYEYFFANFNESRNDTLVAISLENSKDYYLASGKVYDARTVLTERVLGATPIGVNIDIFPMDEFPGDTYKLNRITREVGFLRSLLLFKTLIWNQSRPLIKNLALIAGRTMLLPIDRKALLKTISDKSQKYNNDPKCTKVAVMAVLIYGKKEIFDKKDFEGVVKLEFEGDLYSAPSGYDHILRQVYGDYMQLPPEEARVSTHDYEVFWRE